MRYTILIAFLFLTSCYANQLAQVEQRNEALYQEHKTLMANEEVPSSDAVVPTGESDQPSGNVFIQQGPVVRQPYPRYVPGYGYALPPTQVYGGGVQVYTSTQTLAPYPMVQPIQRYRIVRSNWRPNVQVQSQGTWRSRPVVRSQRNDRPRRHDR